ncbi:sugar ABC transporter ATP-binding protein [Bosea caraganae]|uniref:Sugar ABC transporter ATP-binding protein n=1 Tax=Bosea caraganae TaxID=2763117 RepID=A0A370L178_9HYPH|nr:sugar ABC transporter ATP-binding protein [Bosea caraganae]RDJ21303.1 sugar ABC transporter ATP-binding protein [Bosea caraganae]RDJ26443.1 sugar ABC transporter ATP-binding protein [Bosea caraganae]
MPHLAISRIAKSYDGNPAIRDISFAVEPGRVLALCGENGAGKSTLMKMLAGATLPDSGDILLDGRPARISSPADAMAHGICTVYQELSLLPHLSVAENILLGRLPTRWASFIVDWRKAERIAGQVLAGFGFPDIDPTALVSSLSVAQQQIVEIGKALVTEPRILILDEPTAVLSGAETEKLFAKVRALAAGGTTILYISHRLEEIYAITDEIVVLKDGQSVLAGSIAELDQDRLIHAMVGRPLAAIFPEKTRQTGEIVLEVEKLSQAGAFADVSFAVRAGEILGMFGLVGSGRTEIAKVVFGAGLADAGEVRLNGAAANFADPLRAVRGGVAMLTEDRKGDGLALDCSVIDNAGLASFSRFSRYGIIDGAERRRLVDDKIRDLTVRPRDPARAVRQLSGGNQQKVVIAKWLLVEGIKLFIFDEPTRGVDIATKVQIYRMIRDLADSGMAVLLISSEMPEVLGLSDRLLIVRNGRIAAELPPDAYRPEDVFAHAAGLPVGQASGERLH